MESMSLETLKSHDWLPEQRDWRFKWHFSTDNQSILQDQYPLPEINMFFK